MDVILGALLVLLVVVLGVYGHKAVKQIDMTKPFPSTFVLIRVFNAYYFLEAKALHIAGNLGLYRDTSNIQITDLITYPVKSCKGISLSSCIIDEHGLKYDRMYMFGTWDGKRYASVTQRQCPMLCMCSISKIGNYFEMTWPGSEERFYLPTDISNDYLAKHTARNELPVHLWEVSFNTFALDLDIPQSLRDFLGLPVDAKVLYSPKGKFVKTNIPDPLRSFRSTKFQEYFPLLLMSQEEIDELRYRITDIDIKVTAENFRPNIIVKGVKRPHDIDIWNRITMGGHRWLIVSKCPRCTIPNVDASTGEVDPKSRISKELARYRRCDPGNQYFSFLGVHGIQLDANYSLNVGDHIEVHQKAVNYYKFLE